MAPKTKRPPVARRTLRTALVQRLRQREQASRGCCVEAKGRQVTRLAEDVPIEQRAGAPLVKTKVHPRDWCTQGGKEIVVDLTRVPWLPDDWGQGVKTTNPISRSRDGFGGTYTVWISPEGKVFYHKPAIEQHLGLSRKLGPRDGFRGQLRLAQLQGKQTDESAFFAMLSPKERASLPPPTALHFCVISARRATKPEGMNDIAVLQAQFQRANVEPTWYVDRPSLKDYRRLGLKAVVGGGLTEARNKALQDAERKGKACVQVSDDIARWEYRDGERAKDNSDAAANAAYAAATCHYVSPVAAARAPPFATSCHPTCTMRRWLGLPCLCWVLLSTAIRGQLLEICSGTSSCEVRPQLPTKVCRHDKSDLPPFWAQPFSQLRLRLSQVTASSKEGLGLSELPKCKSTEVLPGPFCRWLEGGPGWLCRDCTEQKCPAVVQPIIGTRDFAAYLPPRGGCIVLESLGVDKMRAKWEWTWDYMVLVRMLAGLALMQFWRELSSSGTVHAVMGGVGSLVFVMLMLLFWITREFRGTVQHAIPFGSSVTVVMLLCTLLPAVRESLFAWLLPSGSSSLQSFLAYEDPFFQLPVGWIAVGVLVLGTCGTVSIGANMSIKYFASAPEPEGTVNFQIGADGRRIDELPPTPAPQWTLGWCFWFLGVVLVLSGSHSDLFSLTVLIVVLVHDQLLHWLRQRLMRFSATSASCLRPLLSKAAFQEQQQANTAAAVQALRDYVRDHPEALWRVGEGSQMRLKHFSEGAPHCPRVYEAATMKCESSCVLL